MLSFKKFTTRYIIHRSVLPLCGFLLLGVNPSKSFARDDNQGIGDFFMMSLEELLDQEVVTASMQPQLLSETISSTHIITAEQLQFMGARTIYDALAHVHGLTVSGNKGGANKLFSRGMCSRSQPSF